MWVRQLFQETTWGRIGIARKGIEPLSRLGESLEELQVAVALVAEGLLPAGQLSSSFALFSVVRSLGGA
jgi:hypothetical protein